MKIVIKLFRICFHGVNYNSSFDKLPDKLFLFLNSFGYNSSENSCLSLKELQHPQYREEQNARIG